MINRVIVWILILSVVPLFAIKDNDFDGVSDSVDECPNTPFLAKVSANGCVIKILTLPSETESNSLQTVLGYGIVVNEDLFKRDEFKSTTAEINYYKKSWSYSLSTGFYEYADKRGSLDTTLKVKKHFKLTSKLKVGLGAGVKLPTYDFKGNKSDYMLYGSLNYYPLKSLSIFMKYQHTFIEDEEINAPLHDSQYLKFGLGYFITTKLYGNLAYTEGNNKFVSQHEIKSLSSSLYYKINKQWFSLFSYKREIEDEDAHHTYNLRVGYRVW